MVKKMTLSREELENYLVNLVATNEDVLIVASDSSGYLVGTTIETSLEILLSNKNVKRMTVGDSSSNQSVVIRSTNILVSVNPVPMKSREVSAFLVDELVYTTKAVNEQRVIALRNKSFMEKLEGILGGIDAGVRKDSILVDGGSVLDSLLVSVPRTGNDMRLLVTELTMLLLVNDRVVKLHTARQDIDYEVLRNYFHSWFGVDEDTFRGLF